MQKPCDPSHILGKAVLLARQVCSWEPQRECIWSLGVGCLLVFKSPCLELPATLQPLKLPVRHHSDTALLALLLRMVSQASEHTGFS